ncbi:MAG: UDP-3-O-acyl-N-acetylglucosamine deacetylase [Terriglobales bacterium]
MPAPLQPSGPREGTIRLPVVAEGVGLHSGASVRMALRPAPAGGGIRFERTDLEGFVVEAHAANIAQVSYATSLMKRGVLISTTEHVLSALVGLEMDNVVVELDNLEVPILDGSALPFVEMLDRARPRQLPRPRRFMRVLRPVELEEGEKFIGLYPDDRYRVSYAINFPHPVIGRQQLEIELTPENYRRELAPARTFGFLRDVEAMRRQGLIRGGSMENAVVLSETGVANGPLRFPDEFVRHKVLDLIGDLALLGHPLRGYVKADRAGHALHTALVKRLARERDLWELETAAPAPAPVLARAAAR